MKSKREKGKRCLPADTKELKKRLKGETKTVLLDVMCDFNDVRCRLEKEVREKARDIRALHRRLDEAEKDMAGLKNLQKSLDAMNNKEVANFRGKIEGLESAIRILKG